VLGAGSSLNGRTVGQNKQETVKKERMGLSFEKWGGALRKRQTILGQPVQSQISIHHGKGERQPNKISRMEVGSVTLKRGGK